MGRAVSVFHRKLMRLAGTALASILSILGMQGCTDTQWAEPTYGVPGFGILVNGTARAAADSMSIQGIRVRCDRVLAGDTTALDSIVTNTSGLYYLEHWEDWELIPDGYSLIISAVDADTGQYGSFGAVDTVIPLTPDMLDDQWVDIDVDLYLPES